MKRHFLIVNEAGRRKAQAFRASVDEVRSPPVMHVRARAPALWMLVICLVALDILIA